MGMFEELRKPYPYEDYVADCARCGEAPMTREEWETPIEGRIGRFIGFTFTVDEA